MERISAPRAVDLACDQLREGILSGEWGAGENLPAERELAEVLGIARLTLRAAIARLEAEGLVRARHGSGVVVLDWRVEAGVELLPWLLARGDRSLLGPILALRRAVASEAVAAAVERASDADLDRLQALADALSATQDLQALAEGNLDFARQMIRLAGNVPLELLFNTVARVYRSDPGLSAAMLADDRAVRASFHAIVALVRTRDAGGARDTVRRVLEAIDAVTLARLEAS